MSAIPYEGHEEERDGEEQETLARPGRPRRQLFNRRSASLLALVVGVIGFYAGVRVEKGQLSSSSSAGSSALVPALVPAFAGGQWRELPRGYRNQLRFAQQLARPRRVRRRRNFDRHREQHQRQDDLHQRQLRKHGQGPALIGDQDHQKPHRRQEGGPSGRLGRDPGRQELQRHAQRNLNQRLRRQHNRQRFNRHKQQFKPVPDPGSARCSAPEAADQRPDHRPPGVDVDQQTSEHPERAYAAYGDCTGRSRERLWQQFGQ